VQVRAGSGTGDSWGNGDNQEGMTLTIVPHAPPVRPPLFDPQADVLVAALQVVFGQQAEDQPSLFGLHLPEQTRLVRRQPVREGCALLSSGSMGSKRIAWQRSTSSEKGRLLARHGSS
jgi:hypothetical protein